MKVLDLLQESLYRSSLARACGAEEHHTKRLRCLSRRDGFENLLHVLEDDVYKEHLVIVAKGFNGEVRIGVVSG